MPDALRIDTNELEWENGLTVVRAMAREFRENLGPSDLVEDLMARYNQKTLRLHPETTRRIDLISLDPGYRDLTNSYHDSVEECFVLGGEFDLDGEGHFEAGDYFWRAPGFVHAANSRSGFTALLSFQGVDPREGSGPVSRRIRPDEEAGTNALFPDDLERSIGPRGLVRHVASWQLAWLPGSVYLRNEGVCEGFDGDKVEFKSLSRNLWTGGQSLLMRLEPGYSQDGHAHAVSAYEFFVLSGSCFRGEERYGTDVYGYVPAGMVTPPLASDEGAVLFLKSDGWLTRLAA